MKRYFATAFLLAAVLVACSSFHPMPTPPMPTHSVCPNDTLFNCPFKSPRPTMNPSPSPTAKPSPTPTPHPSPTPTPTPQPLHIVSFPAPGFIKFSNGQTLYDDQCLLYTSDWKVNDDVSITAEPTAGFYTVVDPTSPAATPNPNYPQPNSSPWDTTTRVMVDPNVIPAGPTCQS